MSPSKKILFSLCGSIACYKSCDLISKLVQEGHEVQTIATESALKFVGKASLEGLTGKTVFTNEYEESRMMNHIHLMNWADLIVVSPATANTINSMAAGTSNNIISSLFLAYDFKKNFIVFPAMNPKMYLHPATQDSIRKLQSWGIKIVEPEEGRVACNESGPGRLPETTYSLDILREFL